MLGLSAIAGCCDLQCAVLKVSKITLFKHLTRGINRYHLRYSGQVALVTQMGT